MLSTSFTMITDSRHTMIIDSRQHLPFLDRVDKQSVNDGLCNKVRLYIIIYAVGLCHRCLKVGDLYTTVRWGSRMRMPT